MVIARFCEDISWISRVPPDIDIYVINKGPTDFPSMAGRIRETFTLSNIGREAHSYISFIMFHFSDLPEIIIFTQGDPFEHSPHFLDLVTEYQQWSQFQPLSLQFKVHLPPQYIREQYSKSAKDKRIWVDRTDCKTLDTVFYSDPDFAYFKHCYVQTNHLDESANIAKHLLNELGCQHHTGMPLDQVNFSFGAIFAVGREAILQHDKTIYSRLLDKFQCDESLPYILERLWMAIFDIEQATKESRWGLPLKKSTRNSRTVHPARDFILKAKSKEITL